MKKIYLEKLIEKEEDVLLGVKKSSLGGRQFFNNAHIWFSEIGAFIQKLQIFSFNINLTWP